MRVGDGHLLQVLLDRLAPAGVTRLQLDLHARAVRAVPVHLFLFHHGRLVLLRVEQQLAAVRLAARRGARDDPRRLPGRQLAVHPRRADADALLPARHAHPVELRAVEQLAENPRHLRGHDARAVVLDRHAEPVLDAVRLRDGDAQFGQNAGLLAGVERVVHRLLHRRQERLARVVEPEQVAVLREELADRNLALLLGKLLGRAAVGDGLLRTGFLRRLQPAAERAPWPAISRGPASARASRFAARAVLVALSAATPPRWRFSGQRIARLRSFAACFLLNGFLTRETARWSYRIAADDVAGHSRPRPFRSQTCDITDSRVHHDDTASTTYVAKPKSKTAGSCRSRSVVLVAPSW